MNKPIGQMNGRWGWLFRVALASYPIAMTALLAFATWVTSTLIRHEVELANRPVREEVTTIVDHAGPYPQDRKYILESLTDIKAAMQRLESKIDR